MIVFTKRNLMVFFKDKASIFFSLLASLIIVVLYLLFLGDVWTNSFHGIENARAIMDNWIMAGLIAITPFTAAMGAFGTMINDKTFKIYKDIYCSSISRFGITAGYIFSSFIIGVILSLFTLVLAQGYILIQGGELISFMVLIKIIGMILLSTFMSTSFAFFIVSFFNSQNGFATASTITGTLIGFLTGIYLPIGMLPNAVQYVIKIFPVSHSAVLLRQIMMEKTMLEAFEHIPIESADKIKQMLGVIFKFKEYTMTSAVHLIILAGTGILFFGLAMLSMSRKKK